MKKKIEKIQMANSRNERKVMITDHMDIKKKMKKEYYEQPHAH